MPPDEVTTHALRIALERLRRGSDPVLRDLAADLQSGRLNLRDVPANTTVRPAFEDGLVRYAQWRASISDTDFSRQLDVAERHLAQTQPPSRSPADASPVDASPVDASPGDGDV